MTPIVERDEHLESLRAAANHARNGRGQIVLLSGEAGVGKSRLISEFLAELPDAITAIGTCERFETPRPLGPLFDMAPALGPDFLAAATSALTGPDLYADLVGAIQGTGAGTVLVFEDAHCAEGPTLDVLNFLCHRVAALQALILISYRNDEISPAHPLAMIMGNCPSRYTSHVQLDCLSAGGVESLAGFLDVSAGDLIERTGGNPFLTLECLRSGEDMRSVKPPSIVLAANTRLAALDPEMREWVVTLAYCPGPADRALIDRLSCIRDLRPELLPGWSGFLRERPDGSIAFRHEIDRESILASKSTGMRRKRAVGLIGALCADPNFAEYRADLIAHLAAIAGDANRVVTYSTLAADQAKSRGNFEASARHLLNALPYAKELGAPVHAELLEQWACRVASSQDVTDAMLELVAESAAEWRRSGKIVALARNHLLLCRLHRHRAERHLAEQHLLSALALLASLPNSAELSLALALQAQMQMELGHTGEAIRIARRSAAIARNSNALPERIDAWITIAHARMRERRQNSEKLLAACRAVSEREGLHDLTARVLACGCDEALAAMNMPSALRATGPLLDHVRESLPDCWRTALDGRAALVRVLGDNICQGEASANHILETTRASPAMRFSAIFALALARIRRHAADGAQALAKAERLAQAIGDVRSIALVRLGAIELAFVTGRPDDARAFLAGMDEPDHACAGWDVDCAVRAWRDRLAGIDSPDDLARTYQAHGYAYEAALAKLFTSGPDSARQIGEAVSEFAAIGAEAGMASARRIAKERGIVLERVKRKRGPYRAARAHPLGLTHREVDILRLIVDGVGNREIAARLGRSLRTVEHHVSAILGKMSVESRVQAALYAVSTPGILEHAEETA